VTPAEKLSKEKRRTRPKRNAPAKSERRQWGTTLRARREALNLSMRDVALAAGLSVSAYFRIENGYADVSLSNAYRLGVLFGVPIQDIWVKWEGGAE
jgi:transcriptional regulator with XRE-family HTH domain